VVDGVREHPTYLRVAADLRGWIVEGVLPAGSKLPSESELMRLYGVSRVTARLAVGTLRQDGLVITRQGHGTFVR
jgi:GntR family transcriptional regulator